jgi:transcriptional regulator with XRE-family HTH domain
MFAGHPLCNNQRLMEATEAERRAFASAVSAQIDGMSRADLASHVALKSGESVSEAAISQWTTGKNEPTRRKVFALESVLGVPPGSLSRHLGYLPTDAVPAVSPEEAIAADTSLLSDTRAMLIAALESQRRR